MQHLVTPKNNGNIAGRRKEYDMTQHKMLVS